MIQETEKRVNRKVPNRVDKEMKERGTNVISGDYEPGGGKEVDLESAGERDQKGEREGGEECDKESDEGIAGEDDQGIVREDDHGGARG